LPSPRLRALAAVALLLAFAACGGDDDDPARSTATAVSGTPASSTPPGSATSPTVAAPPVTADAYSATPVYPHIAFQRMVALVQIPGTHEAVVLTQQQGLIYRANLNSQDEPTVFLDLRGKVTPEPANEEGILGFAFSPDFDTDRRVFVHYSAANPRRGVVERYNVVGGAADPASGRVILEVPDPYGNHNGGSIEFGPDGYLYIALGDGGAAGDPQQRGQNLNEILGKIHRIDVSGDTYTVPPDNPFVGQGRGEIWAYGLRNPWRMTFDRGTGDLWLGDVGQGEWEEVNRIERGGNYGWSVMEGPDCFQASDCDQSGLTPPITYYALHENGTCAVTGGYVHRPAPQPDTTPLPELIGWYVYGDFCSGQVWALNTADVSAAPIELMDTDYNISSFAQEEDGSLLLVTFQGIYEIARE
jgi:glucose/arabinose dehydrogenase